jgi:hypothetical protein
MTNLSLASAQIAYTIEQPARGCGAYVGGMVAITSAREACGSMA